ncbi:MAG: hypothetical protein ACUVSH_00405 [Anaerolineae bacterium]
MKPLTVGVTIAVLLLLLACACCTWLVAIDWERLLEPLISAVEPTAEPPVTPQLTRAPLPPEAAETERLLETTLIPVRDLHELAIRLRGIPPETPRTINPEGAPDYPLGTCRTFHASNVDTDEQFDLTACLRYKNDVVYMWVEEGVKVDEADLKAAADLFATKTYPTNRNFFGSEWNPGVDNDPRLHILHARNLGDTVAGYYSSADEFVPAVREDSNAMEMFYIQIENVTVNDDFYNGVLAHEFQHMIHWYNDRNEDTWLNEGSSELASYLNGHDTGGSDYVFSRRPDTQLNSWPEGPGAAGANYGASYLFMAYFLDRFGAEATRALVAHDENGFAAVDAVLADLGTGMTHVDLFADWVVANLLDDPNLADGQYGYREIDPPPFKIETRLSSSDYPATRQATVHQYAADYIELKSDRPLRFSFTGSTQVGLMDTHAHSGKYLWWSNRGDDSDITLTREFDLTGVEKATLEYWCWYDIEEDWDYAYVEVSTDGGKTWKILVTPSGTPENPNGNSFGWGYTGRSGGRSKAEWIQERVDLTPYAGQKVLVRFEYITDDAVNRPGFAVDDVAVPEIGYFSDFEADGGGWEAAGFVRHANVLPQRWLVQLVLFGPQTTVQRLELNPDQTGEWEIPLGGGVNRAVVIISAYAPVTTEVASYQYSVR